MTTEKRPRAKRGVKYFVNKNREGFRELYREFVINPTNSFFPAEYVERINREFNVVITETGWRPTGWNKSTPEQRATAMEGIQTVLDEVTHVMETFSDLSHWSINSGTCIRRGGGRSSRRIEFRFPLTFKNETTAFNITIQMEFTINKKEYFIREFRYRVDHLWFGGKEIALTNLFLRKAALGGKFTLKFDGGLDRNMQSAFSSARSPKEVWSRLHEFLYVVTNKNIGMLDLAANICGEQFTSLALETLCGITNTKKQDIYIDSYGHMKFGHGTKVSFADIVSKFEEVEEPLEEDDNDE